MKRYDLMTNYRCGSTIEEMEPADDGEWVRYEEVAAVIAGYEQRMKLIEWFSQSHEQPASRSVAVDPVEGSDHELTPRATGSSCIYWSRGPEGARAE